MNPVTRQLVKWYRSTRVNYPWRETQDPYRVWLSEILLQQTRIPVVLRYYEKILSQFPTIESLAAVDYPDFARLWSGIGYYSRARNMHACAQRVVADHGGRFPTELETLRSLPGFGPYTAGALRNLCFQKLSPAVDANVARVLARLTANRESAGNQKFQSAIADSFLDLGRKAPPSDYFQSLMELGERVCLPQPRCAECPVQKHCPSHLQGIAAEIPVRKARARSQPFHWYFLLISRGGAYYLAQNPSRDFLKDAWLFPDILSEKALTPEQLMRQFRTQWKIQSAGIQETGSLRHSVTFRRITCHVFKAGKCSLPPAKGMWIQKDQMHQIHTSSVVHKVFRLA